MNCVRVALKRTANIGRQFGYVNLGFFGFYGLAILCRYKINHNLAISNLYHNIKSNIINRYSSIVYHRLKPFMKDHINEIYDHVQKQQII
jgi:hypothetical protein